MEISRNSFRVVVVTSTLFRNEYKDEAVRATLALKSAEILRDLRIPVIAVDGGSDLTIQNWLRDVGVTLQPQLGATLGSARREVIKRAVQEQFDIIVYTELEKCELVSEIPQLSGPVERGEAEIVVPSRIDMASYPEFQRLSERLGNLYFESLFGTYFDLFFGPKVFSRNAARYFTEYEGEYGDSWDGVVIPVVRAFRDQRKIISVPTAFKYPCQQRETEERDPKYVAKRFRQLEMIVKAFEREWNNHHHSYS